MGCFPRTAALLAVLFLVTTPSLAQDKRVALVIGNSAYKHTPRLVNPGNDAADMVAKLRQVGFDVIVGLDLDKSAMDRTIHDFAETLVGAEVALFFYAGHGLQVNGQNYLVPIDAKLTTAAAIDFEMVRLDLVHRTMERETKTNILIMDACRDNPLARNLARALGTRSSQIGRGLAAVESGEGTLISFSTQPGNVALDGDGRNSPFAAALLKYIAALGDDLSTILINVRNDVMRATARRQVPWEHSAMTAKFYFTPPIAAPGRPGEADAKGSVAGTWVEESQRAEHFARMQEMKKAVEELRLAREAAAAAKKAAEDAIANKRAGEKGPEKLAVLPKTESKSLAPTGNVRQFNGTWGFSYTVTFGCGGQPRGYREFVVADGVFRVGYVTGRVSENGAIRWTVPSRRSGGLLHCAGTILGATGAGTCNSTGEPVCRQRFTLRRR